MTYSLEVIVNTGQFEHAKLTINAKSEAELIKLMDLSDSTVRAIGTFGLAVKSQVLYGRDNPEVPVVDERPPAQLIQEELDGKVLEVVEHREPPSWAVSVTPEPKPWPEIKAEVKTTIAANDGDDW